MTNSVHGNTLNDEVLREAGRDPVNITVYGNPVLDVIVDVSESSRHIVERSAIEQIATICPNGNLEFRPDTYVCFYLGSEPIVWGPFNPKNQQEVYSVGEKYPISIRSGEAAEQILESNEPAVYSVGEKYPIPILSGDTAEQILESNPSVAIIAGPTQRLGGGGANVLFGFYDVFAQLKVELTATSEKIASGKRGRLDPFVVPLTKKIGPYTKIQLYNQPGINLAIEGLGSKKDRIIFTAEIPNQEEIIENIPEPRGKAIMVNTLYSPQVALDALAYACAPDRLGILALTKSLCNKKKIESSFVDKVLKRHTHIRLRGDLEIKSVRDFITKLVLPSGNCILIMNEAEIEHLTEVHVGIHRRETYLPTLGGVVQALRAVRTFQQSIKERVYVTLGANGAMILTESDNLIYCGIVEDRSKVPTGKTAIGDHMPPLS